MGTFFLTLFCALVGLRVVVVLTALTATLQAHAEKDPRGESSEGKEAFGRIIGGTPTSPMVFKWQVYLQVQKGTPVYRCGGSILNMKWILSAAHCFSDVKLTDKNVPDGFKITATRISIYAGVTDTNNLGHPVQGQTINKEDINNHLHICPTYNQKFLVTDDYALIKLIIELLPSPVVGSIILGTEQDVAPGKCVRASGYGLTDGGKPNAIIQSVSGLRLIPEDQCEEYIKNNEEFQIVKFTFTKRMLCSINYKSGTCTGYSGGPVITGEKGNSDGPPFVQIGVISFGLPEWEDEKTGLVPDVYVNIPKFRQDIYRKIEGVTCQDQSSSCLKLAAQGLRSKASCSCGTDCKDSSSKCPSYAEKGKCSTSKYHFKCKESCACTGSDCKDSSRKCLKYAQEGKCNKSKIYFKCKESCACGPSNW